MVDLMYFFNSAMAGEMKSEELRPAGGQKSFYGKAKAYAFPNGARLLTSYGTAIMFFAPSGTPYRVWEGWSKTTGKHIKAFSGLNKKEFESLVIDERAQDLLDFSL